MDNSRAFIVIPTLNEEDHIADVIAGLSAFSAAQDAPIVVVDGGSRDKTRDIVRSMMATTPCLALLENPDRLQSAAVNKAVAVYGDDYDILIRIDAHSRYPSNYCDVLIAQAQDTGADSVVTSMNAVGKTSLQSSIATAQNSPFGNGGAAHRNRTEGQWVDHGHHALIRVEAFRAVDGYDPNFSHNEDAELDHRLRQSGYRIWLTAKTQVTYFPRASLPGLCKQYFSFGRGRARTLAKHGMRPALRQLVVAALAPALLLACLAPLSTLALLPLVLWLFSCLVAGLILFQRTTRLRDIFAGFAAGLMHTAWSAGFWYQTLGRRPQGHG